MFELLQIKDKTIIKPEDLKSIPFEDILIIKLREKYIGKILNKKGIVASIKSLIVTGNFIVEIEGIINVEYLVELIVFNPTNGDILIGFIESCNSSGILVNCDICKVFIDKSKLPDNSNFVEMSSSWFWDLGDNRFYYDKGEKVKVKIVDVVYREFVDEKNIIKDIDNNKNTDEIMIINGSFNQSGLGPINWWIKCDK